MYKSETRTLTKNITRKINGAVCLKVIGRFGGGGTRISTLYNNCFVTEVKEATVMVGARGEMKEGRIVMRMEFGKRRNARSRKRWPDEVESNFMKIRVGYWRMRSGAKS